MTLTTATGQAPRRPGDPAPDGPRPSPWARHGWWVLPPVVLALLGGWLVARQHGLWYDELYTAEVAPLPLGDLVRALVRGEGTIPYLRDAPPSYNAPYYAVVHLWLAVTGLHADEWGLRVFSLITSVGAVGVFTRAVNRLAGQRVALVAGLVTATNPFVVQFSAEGRGYGLAILAISLSALGFARWLGSGVTQRRPDDRERPQLAMVLFGVAGAVAGLAHWFALLVVVAFAVAAVILRGRAAVPVVAVAAVACVPAAGIIGIALANGVGASGAEWISEAGGAVPRLLLSSWAGGHTPLLIVTVLAAVAGLLARSQQREARTVAAMWFLVPVVAVTALELVRPVFVDRYLLPALLGLAVLVALGVTAASRRVSAVAVAAVLAVSVAATVSEVQLGPKEDVRGAVAAVAAGHTAGEPVVAAARWDALGVDHYIRRDHQSLLPDVVLPPSPVPQASTVWVVRRAKGGVKGDRTKLEALDLDLESRGLYVADERRFEGRYSDVLVQRWEAAQASVLAD